jgi:hypothetical protein
MPPSSTPAVCTLVMPSAAAALSATLALGAAAAMAGAAAGAGAAMGKGGCEVAAMRRRSCWRFCASARQRSSACVSSASSA